MSQCVDLATWERALYQFWTARPDLAKLADDRFKLWNRIAGALFSPLLKQWKRDIPRWSRALPALARAEREGRKTETLNMYGAQHEALMAEITVHPLPRALAFIRSQSATQNRKEDCTEPTPSRLPVARPVEPSQEQLLGHPIGHAPTNSESQQPNPPTEAHEHLMDVEADIAFTGPDLHASAVTDPSPAPSPLGEPSYSSPPLPGPSSPPKPLDIEPGRGTRQRQSDASPTRSRPPSISRGHKQIPSSPSMLLPVADAPTNVSGQKVDNHSENVISESGHPPATGTPLTPIAAVQGSSSSNDPLRSSSKAESPLTHQSRQEKVEESLVTHWTPLLSVVQQKSSSRQFSFWHPSSLACQSDSEVDELISSDSSKKRSSNPGESPNRRARDVTQATSRRPSGSEIEQLPIRRPGRRNDPRPPWERPNRRAESSKYMLHFTSQQVNKPT
ncbi:uncharacterized protein PHACADRAFT_208230, partial [Phanerochaete carnosa HHB-10118-sp]